MVLHVHELVILILWLKIFWFETLHRELCCRKAKCQTRKLLMHHCRILSVNIRAFWKWKQKSLVCQRLGLATTESWLPRVSIKTAPRDPKYIFESWDILRHFFLVVFQIFAVFLTDNFVWHGLHTCCLGLLWPLWGRNVYFCCNMQLIKPTMVPVPEHVWNRYTSMSGKRHHCIRGLRNSETMVAFV